MKKASLRVYTCLLIAVSFLSCNEEPPTPMQYLADYLIIPGSCIAIITCPNAGTNCDNMEPHPGAFRSDQLAMLTTFHRMSGNDSARYFFDNYNWQEMFPKLNARDEVVSKVISGEYKVRLMGDSSVVIVSDLSTVSSNIIYAFNYNRATLPCN